MFGFEARNLPPLGEEFGHACWLGLFEIHASEGERVDIVGVGESVRGHTDEEWIARIEAWQVNPASWNIEEDGPPPNDPNHRIPLDVIGRFKDRQARAAKEREKREGAAAKQAAADAELRNRLLAAANGNFQPGPGLDDVGPIREVLKVLPLDRVLMVIRQKVDRRCYPSNPPLVSWRDPAFLRALAEDFCRVFAVPGLVSEWGNAGRAPATKAPSSPPTGEMPDDIDELRRHHDNPHAPPGPHSLPGAVPSAAPDVSANAADASEAPAAVSAPLEPESAPASSPPQPGANPNDGPAGSAGAAEPLHVVDADRIGSPSRESILAAFARNRVPPQPVAPQPRPPEPVPQPRPQRQAAPAEPQMSEEAWEELVAGYVAGNVNWNVRRLGPEPGQPNCRAPRHILRSFRL
jgi:hypothetical protein